VEAIAGIYSIHDTDGQVSIPPDRPPRDVTITSW
jgi:hypothetical protein